MTTPTDVHAAAELVGHALRPRTSAGRSDGYATLRDRYRNEPSFAEIVDAVADGLGLRTLGVVTGRLVVTPTAESVFAARTGDYADASMSVEERMLHGLAQLAVAAYCYPTPQSLSDPRTITVEPVKVAAELTEVAVRLDTGDRDRAAGADADALREAWRGWLALAETGRTPTGLLSKWTRHWYVDHTCRWLVRQGLMTESDDGYRTTGAYQLHVRDIASDVRFELVAGDTPADADPEDLGDDR